MRRRHYAAARASLQHSHFQTAHATPCRLAQSHPTKNRAHPKSLSTPVRNKPATVYSTEPGSTLYGELEPIVNETEDNIRPGSKNEQKQGAKSRISYPLQYFIDNLGLSRAFCQ